MSYLNNQILKSLKRARKAKGISQRELSAKSGVPQSHISKIENGAVDLRVSSLVALARTLDLELELVPRKTVPAVQSIVRKSINIDLLNKQMRAQEIFEKDSKIINAISNVGKINLSQHELDKLRTNINDISLSIPKIDSAQFDVLQSSIKAIEESFNSENSEKVKRAFEKINSIRNTLAHSKLENITKSLPAYSLDNEVDDE